MGMGMGMGRWGDAAGRNEIYLYTLEVGDWRWNWKMDWFFECNKQPLKETTHISIKYLSVANFQDFFLFLMSKSS